MHIFVDFAKSILIDNYIDIDIVFLGCRAVARGVQGLQLQPSIFEIKVQLHPLIFRSQDLVLRM